MQFLCLFFFHVHHLAQGQQLNSTYLSNNGHGVSVITIKLGLCSQTAHKQRTLWCSNKILLTKFKTTVIFRRQGFDVLILDLADTLIDRQIYEKIRIPYMGN